MLEILDAGALRSFVAGRLSPPGVDPSWEKSITLPKKIGKCPDRPTVTHFTVDSSGSVTAGSGNDPIGKRWDEVMAGVSHLARRCRCHDEWTSLTHFDFGTSYDVKPIGLDARGVDEFRKGAQTPHGIYGISELGPALTCIEGMAASMPDFDHAIVVISDFELFDPPDVMDRFCSFRGAVHAVVLRAEPPPRLLHDPRVTVTRITSDSPRGAVAEAILAGLTSTREVPA